MSTEPEADRQWPPTDRYAADDLDRIPGLPSHAELIDGALVIRGPQRPSHMSCLRFLEEALHCSAPWDRFRVSREMPVVLGPRQRPEPDLIVVHTVAMIERS